MKKIATILFLTLFLYASEENYLLGLKAYYDKNSSNDTQAITLLSQAATEQKNADAAFLLGVAYGEGNIVPKDLRKSLYWYKLLGDKDAMLLVGWYYYKGEAVEQNLEKAKMWFEKAAKLGDTEAMEMAQFIEEMMAGAL